MQELLVQLLNEGARPPQRTRRHDAGLDLRCLKAFELDPGQRLVVDTGFAMALPQGTGGLVLPRSGLAIKHGVTVLNAPGLVDSEYRGPVKVALVNHSQQTFRAAAGDRIAQLLIVSFSPVEVTAVDRLPTSADGRGVGGFGSSGIS